MSLNTYAVVYVHSSSQFILYPPCDRLKIVPKKVSVQSVQAIRSDTIRDVNLIYTWISVRERLQVYLTVTGDTG